MYKPVVLSLNQSPGHTMRKMSQPSITLIEGLGVEGDAHMGEKVKHRYFVRKDPTQPNLRQVHLIHSELHTELGEKGFEIGAGEMGENITTGGIDLLGLARNTVLHIGKKARVKVTGLRSPCSQLDEIQPGLMKAVLDRDEEGKLVLKAGIMGIVLEGGLIEVGDEIRVEAPEDPFLKLGPV